MGRAQGAGNECRPLYREMPFFFFPPQEGTEGGWATDSRASDFVARRTKRHKAAPT